MCRNLKLLSKLELLNIAGCVIKNTGIKLLSKNLIYLPNLKDLNIQCIINYFS